MELTYIVIIEAQKKIAKNRREKKAPVIKIGFSGIGTGKG